MRSATSAESVPTPCPAPPARKCLGTWLQRHADPDHAAPQLIDAEVMSVIVRHHRRRLLDPTSAGQAVDDLRTWPGERWPLTVFSDRVWEPRDTVRSYDAYYVALAEALDAALVTCDRRLARAAGPTCEIVVPPD